MIGKNKDSLEECINERVDGCQEKNESTYRYRKQQLCCKEYWKVKIRKQNGDG